MAAQKRPAPPSDHRRASDGSPPPLPPPPAQHQLPQQREGEQQPPANQLPELPQEQDDSEGEEGGSPSSPSTADKDEFIIVKLADIRKEVQCPICLGIIRKTRTVMECLHRFCRECIDKSMRLGNNECPACRTHCASRRSLRDDPNYDALISLLYPDIDVYEEEELAFHEEEKTRNRKIQACIAETFRRQSEALGRRRSTAKATAAAFVRKSHGNLRSGYQRGRGRTAGREGSRDTSLAGSDEEEDANANGSSKDSSSAEERSPEVRQKRCRRWAAPRSSPGRTSGDANAGYNENDELELSQENFRTSPLRARKREMLAWGKAGARSQTRHGSSSGLNGRFFKGGRVTKLVECLRNLDENDDEFDLHLTLLPLDDRSVPNLQRPYLCCRPTLSIRHLCQFIALQTSVQAEEIEIFAWKPQGGTLSTNSTYPMGKAEYDPSEELTILGAQESLAGLHASLSSTQGDLVLLYRLKTQS